MEIDAIDRELRAAIQARNVTSVKRLLDAGAALDYQGAAGETPLHFCLSNYCWKVNAQVVQARNNKREKEIEIIRELIAKVNAVNGVSDILDCWNDSGQSPLYEAIEAGDLETVELLVHAGARIENINRENETALHVATRAQQHHVLKYFLDNHNIPNSNNKHNITAMHFSAISNCVESMKLLIEKFGPDHLVRRNWEGDTVWHEIAAWHSIEIAQYLLQARDFRYRADLNLLDNKGRTPVLRAAAQGDAAMTALLLRNGAALEAKRATESEVIKKISKEFTNPLTFLRDIFDDCVYETKKCVNVDYKVLTDSYSHSSDSKGLSQIKVIEELVRWNQNKLLKHPMIESLIYLKWKCFLPMFYLILATYAIFLGTFTVFVVRTYNKIDTYNRTQNGSSSTNDFVDGGGRTLIGFIYMSISVLLIQECVWLRLRRLRYLAHREPWLKLLGLVLAALVPPLLGSAPAHWHRYVACAALLLAWLQAMLLLSRIPGWGYYVLMFESVAINVLKVLLTSICLVVGFSACFMILYQSKPPFDGFIPAFVKTLVMMLSEFDYEDLFGDEHAELEDTRPFVRLLFVTFVIFIAIVMMNFLVGVAVTDINELNDIGDVRRLEKQVELLSTLEGLADTVLAKWWKRLSHIRFHSDMGRPLTDQGRRWLVYPNQYNRSHEYFHQTFPPELHNAICNLAIKKKPTVNKLDALYDAIIEPHNSKGHDTKHKDQDQDLQVTLKDRIKSIEDVNREIKQSMEDLMKLNDRINSTEEMKQYIYELRKDMNMILRITAQSVRRTMPGHIVSSKAVSRKRHLKGERKKKMAFSQVNRNLS